jgi:hypothetical protein
VSEFKMAVRKTPAEYEPGEEIAGAAQWLLDEAPSSVEVRLLWRTSGRGDSDLAVVGTVGFDSPLQDDTRSFTFTAPEAPYSFDGALITLGWALELVALPGKECAHVELVIAPGGRMVVLREVG